MSYWNQGYNQKKQKEMLREAVEKERTKELKPLYKEPFEFSSSSSLQRKREKIRKEKFVWTVGFVIMGIISVVGIYTIYWAMNI